MPHFFETLGLTRAPRVEDLLERQGVKLFDLMVVGLIERDGPMPVAEIAARLGSAGVVARTGDVAMGIERRDIQAIRVADPDDL